MKKKILTVFTILCFVCMMFVAGCGDRKVIDGVEYDTYGFINKDEKKNPDIQYEMIIGNVVWSFLLIETIIAPIYFWGFSIYEPIGKKGDLPKGGVRKAE